MQVRGGWLSENVSRYVQVRLQVRLFVGRNFVSRFRSLILSCDTEPHIVGHSRPVALFQNGRRGFPADSDCLVSLSDRRGFPVFGMQRAAKTTPLVDFFTARVEYISCVHKGDAASMPIKLQQDTTSGFLKQIANTKFLPIEVATAITKMVSDCNLSDDAKAHQVDGKGFLC